MAVITAQRIIDLKALIKAECKRRKYTGSVSAYGGTSYDFSTVPAAGKQIKKEHYEKLSVPLNAISGAQPTDGARVVSESELAAMEAEVARLKKISATAANAGCAASCTGLCKGGCATGCSGCTGCSGDCEGGCSGSCGVRCVGGCTNVCTGCQGSCDSVCADSCALICSAGCTGNCHSTSNIGFDPL